MVSQKEKFFQPSVFRGKLAVSFGKGISNFMTKQQPNVGWNMSSAMTSMHFLFAMQWCLIHAGIGVSGSQPEMVEHIT